MSFVPSAELLRDIALCAACTQDASAHGTRRVVRRSPRALESRGVHGADVRRREQTSLQRLVHGVLTSPDGGAQLLSAFDRQRRALRLVLEAHARGAVRLPESIADTVERACRRARGFSPAVAIRRSTGELRLAEEDALMIQVKCVGGECNGLTVKVEPQPTYYEVVDPRDPTRRDYYILEVGQWGARLVPEATAEWRARV